MSAPTPTQIETALAQMVAIWRHGEAAQHDPVMINMLARHAAYLNRIAPGTVDKVRATFEVMYAHGDHPGAASAV